MPVQLLAAVMGLALLIVLPAAAVSGVRPSSLPAANHSVLLRNAAEPGVYMPLTGLGMPCGPGACGQSSYEATLTFLALGGRHTDSASHWVAPAASAHCQTVCACV